jgi:glucan phosphoethanolaminetransferase (alkaline phosphatase superfamily)
VARGFCLSAAVLGRTLLVTITEALGAMHALTRPAVIATWSIIAVAAFLWVRRRPFPPRLKVDLVNAILILSIAAILGIVAFIAVRSRSSAFRSTRSISERARVGRF